LRVLIACTMGTAHVAELVVPASATSPLGMHRRAPVGDQYYDREWRATFYTTGMEHSPTSATGTGWERTPWHAAQRAAWEALKESGP
jgi:hypothetical protein